MTEEEYILTHGGDDIIGQSIIYQSSHERMSAAEKDIDAFNKELGKIVETNTRLRTEFREKVAQGEIHKDTPVEILLRASVGHEDNEATHAARRALRKRGIKYDSVRRD